MNIGFSYPYSAEPQPDGGFTVVFPDVPEAISEGDTFAAVHANAEEALVAALSFYVDDGQPLPKPSVANGQPVAHVPLLIAVKLALHEAMLEAGISNSELARRMELDEKTVRRLRDPLHRSHAGQVEAALRFLGRRIDARVVELI